ncbi:MAG: PA2169 family four-helix-bundle protein [Bacteroidota bacterium]
MDKAKVKSALNDLLKRSHDAHKGYQEAARDVSDGALRSWLNNTANRRSIHISDLQLQIGNLGGDADHGTSFLGDMHRAWIDFKSSIMDGDTVVLNECIRGEERALEDYDEVLKERNLNPTIANLLRKHRMNIQDDLNSLRSIEETLSVAQ